MANKEKLSFAAIDPFGIINFKEPVEHELKGSKGVVTWGDKNDYPDYLLSLYNEVGTLRSIINGCVDYTIGNGIRVEGSDLIKDSIPDLVKMLIHDYWIYGGFAYQVIRNKLKEPTKYVYLDFRNIRVSEDGLNYYYSKDWSKTWGRCKYLVYPKYDPEDLNQPTGIVYVKNVFNQHYPTPVYGAKTTIQACEIEKEITAYHYNSIQNGFVGGYSFDFHNGIPSDEEKKEIEKNILEKYTGTGNAARILINFADDKDHGLELTRLETEDFGEKYSSLTKKSQQEIFSSFRANPNLFGLPTENLGFNNEEYESTFKLFNRTMIKPVQNLIIDNFAKEDIQISFEPFTL